MIKNILKSTVLSQYSIEHYRRILTFSLKATFATFFIYILIVSLVTGIFESKNFIDKNYETIYTNTIELEKKFPDDLELKVEDGKLHANKEFPIVISFNQKLPIQVDNKTILLDNLITLDNNATLDNFEDYSSLFVINEKNIIFRGENSKLEVVPLNELNGLYVNKEKLSKLLNQTIKDKHYVQVLANIVLFSKNVFYFSITRLLTSIFVFIYLAVLGLSIGAKNLSLKNYYQITLHSALFPITADAIRIILDINTIYSLWFAFLNMLIGGIVVYYLKDDIKNDKEPVLNNQDVNGKGDSEDKKPITPDEIF